MTTDQPSCNFDGDDDGDDDEDDVMMMAGETEAHQRPRRGMRAHHLHTPDVDG